MLTSALPGIPPGLTALFMAGLAATTLLRRRGQSFNGLFGLLCLLGCFLNIDLLMQMNAVSAEAALRSTRRWHLVHPFIVPLFIHFFQAHLGIGGRIWIVVLAYGNALAVALFSQGDLVIARVDRFFFGYAAQAGPLYGLMVAGALISAVYNAWILFAAVKREKRSVIKNKLRYMFAGFLSLGVLTCLNLPSRYGVPIYPPGGFGFLPLMVFAAGVMKYDLLEWGELLCKSVRLVLLAMPLALACGLFFLGLQTYPRILPPLVSSALVALCVVLSAIAVSILHFRTPSLVERLQIGQSYDYRGTVKRASRKIASVLNYGQISSLLQETLIQCMQIEHCALFIGDDRGATYRVIAAVGRAAAVAPGFELEGRQSWIQSMHALGAPLIRHRVMAANQTPERGCILSAMTRLQAEVVLPMIFQGRLNGFLILGEKRSGRIYGAGDLDLLETLGHQSALAIENTRAYEALKAVNRTLELRVTQRTRELEQALEEKERTQEQLVRSESLAAIGQLVAGVAHELNNPLASVTSLVQSTIEDLERTTPDGTAAEALIDDLRFADKEMARATSIVASLLGLSRQTQTYQERVDLHAVVADALRVLANRVKRRPVDIRRQFTPGPVIVQGNFANLGQAVVNVIANAIQAVPSSAGKIILRTELRDGGTSVRMVCEDNGAGIDPAICSDVFKPFYTTKPVGQGTGLGLYICHEIIERHGGTIAIGSSILGGAAVGIQMPLASGANAATASGADGASASLTTNAGW